MTTVCKVSPFTGSLKPTKQRLTASYIANYLLLRYVFPEDIQMTEERMHLILYFINRYYLKMTGTSIFNNRIMATSKGIKIEGMPDIYTYFYLGLIRANDRKKYIFSGRDGEMVEAIEQVWNESQKYSTRELYKFATLPGSPWDKARNEGKLTISTMDILND